MVENILPLEKRIKFFVYIIESPSPADMYHKRFEGDMLQKAVSLDRIPSAHRVVVNREAFHASVIVGLGEEMKVNPNLVPIIHISAHGSAIGVQLTSGEVITWEELKSILLPLNKALNGGLLICMSSCEGISACRMAMSEEGETPFFAVIGNQGKPTWSDTAVGYAAFYHLIAKGCFVLHAVNVMKEASGHDGFAAITADEARKAFIDVINQDKVSALQVALEKEKDQEPTTSSASELEKSKPNY